MTRDISAMAEALRASLERARQDYLADRAEMFGGPDGAGNAPGWLAQAQVTNNVPAIFSTFLEVRDRVISLLSYLSLRQDKDRAADVLSETDGDTGTLVVKVGDTWVGSVSLTLTQDMGDACVRHANYQMGLTYEVNGELLARFVCRNPDHPDHDTQPLPMAEADGPAPDPQTAN